MAKKEVTILLKFLLVGVLSYNLGYTLGNYHSNRIRYSDDKITTTRSISSSSRENDTRNVVASPRPIFGTYEYSTDNKCRVIDYDHLQEDKFSCVHLKINNTPYICVYNESEDRYVSRSIIRQGTWENYFVYKIITMLRKEPELAFIDIGSNIGQFSLVAASMGRKVIAVDALKRHTLMLGRAVVMNSYQHLVKIVHNALSDTYHNVSLVSFQGNPGMTRVKTMKYTSKQVSEIVPAILMDDLLPLVNFRRAIMKIDIEGLEVAALSHSIQLFTKVDIPIIFMEWWGGYDEHLYETQEEIAMVTILISRLKTQGYKVYSKNMRALHMSNWRQWPFEIVWKK